jgi:putative ABC transport system substrate-binding protein
VKRRKFITLLGGAATVWPLTARAQQPVMPVIGFFSAASPASFSGRIRAFQQGLSETGYAEGRNVAIEFRWANDRLDRLPDMAADLVRRPVAVIAATGTPTALAAKAATTTIPIVFQTVADPVQIGLVASLNRPGGNLTGLSTLGLEVGPKQLELLHRLIPAVTTMALLVNPTFPDTTSLAQKLQSSARALGLDLYVMHASGEHDFDAVFNTIRELRAGALVITTNPLFTSRRERLATLALRHGIPAIYQYREFAAAGGLMSYGASFTDSLRLVGIYTGRILNGEKPADLPVQQATKLELVLNLNTAKALGLAIPETVLALADEVIE